MKKVKVIAGVTALVLALGILTACGQKQEEQMEDETQQQEELENAAQDVTAEDELVENPAEEDNEDIVDEEQTPEEEPMTDEEEQEHADEEAAEKVISVAELTKIEDDGSLTVTLYGAQEDPASLITDYTDVDFTMFEGTEERETLELHEDMLFYLACDGALEQTDRTALAEGCMLLLITEADGTEVIVIYEPVADSAA